MRLDRSFRYVFMLRGKDGVERIAIRYWNGLGWRTWPLLESEWRYRGDCRVVLSPHPFWRKGPRMVLEVPA